ncbi:MAG: hypothetical protein OH319_03490 [Candidatus Parvarchaeota archaeon]|nr:hypothetical protein [Candidatus Jingweiarchaeum tengchongense]MCW1304568.1 hypothetical protein [Candidatus Jingweiarchaeum tengchongense]MCW1310240.1 hypothetical protein [Candidatus Jingweiarchaeum tengchongense]
MNDDIKKMLENHERRISELEKLILSKPEIVKKKTSLKEFLLFKKPKDDVQKTLAISYYLEKYEGLTSVNAKDLEDGFRLAKEKVPKNINYKVIRNIQQGYMMEAKEKKDNLKAWSLTGSGERFVENGFKKE